MQLTKKQRAVRRLKVKETYLLDLTTLSNRQMRKLRSMLKLPSSSRFPLTPDSKKLFTIKQDGDKLAITRSV